MWIIEDGLKSGESIIVEGLQKATPGKAVTPQPAKFPRRARDENVSGPQVSRFFINRPIVAMVISIITVIVGLVTLFGLPISKFPNIVPPECKCRRLMWGLTRSPWSSPSPRHRGENERGGQHELRLFLNANSGSLRMTVNYDVATDPNVIRT